MKKMSKMIRFRAKTFDYGSEKTGDEYVYGLPLLEFTVDAKNVMCPKWYLRNFEICERKNGKEYLSSYSITVDANTFEVCYDGIWETCKILDDIFTKGYKLTK